MVDTFLPPFIEPQALLPRLRERGYAVLAPAGVATLCGTDLRVLDGLQPAWDDLQPDRYLKDGGNYRKRRHSCFVSDHDQLLQAPHRAHWQSEEYNALHGGMRRWFEPMLAHSVAGEGGDLVTLLVGRDAAWRIRSPRLDVDVAGTGDVLAALLATFLLRGEPPQRAAERALAGVHAALESTLANGWEELDVLAAPAAALAEVPRFQAVPV